jgi:hypothetical protein
VRAPADSRCVVVSIAGYTINEEQAQHLDSAIMKLQLLIEVLLHGVPNLHAPNVVTHSPHFLTDAQCQTVRKTDELGVRLGV